MGPRAKPAVEALLLACSDRDPELRQAAEEALRRVDPQAAARVGNR
jgi:hypothetical protein